MRAAWRRVLLGGALVLSIGAALSIGDAKRVSEPDARHQRAEPAPPISGRAGNPGENAGGPPIAPLALELLVRAPPVDAERSFGAGAAWRPPPPAAAARREPEPPPFPYVAFGALHHDGVVTVFLRHAQKPDQLLLVRQGDTIEKQFEVREIAPRHMKLVYLPLDKERIVPLGGH